MLKSCFKDADNKPVNAHGGMILEWKNQYYWYGEFKTGQTVRIRQTMADGKSYEVHRLDFAGISCYRSKDLQTWHCCGLALEACPEDRSSDLHPGGVVERPRVIYHAGSQRFVMYMHIDSPDYSKAALGVAVADRPEGPFRYLYGFRPCECDSRDFTLWQDKDTGAAYVLFSSDWNSTLRIARLTDDYLQCTGTFTEAFVGCYREAPVIFRENGQLFCITSGCTGWAPNAAAWATAAQPEGPWRLFGNPCLGNDADKTFGGQATCSVMYQGQRYILADVWNSEDLAASTYIWMLCDMQSGQPIMTRIL